MAAARVRRRRRAPVVGGEGERAAEIPHLLAHLTAATDGNGDGYRGGATRLEGRRRRQRLGQRRGSATGDERARDLAQTVEDD
jgi:Domain of unknown function (DUF834).